MTPAKFLLDTITHYNSDNRSVNPSFKSPALSPGMSKCTYLPAHPGTEGCAIGRKIGQTVARKLDNATGNGSMAIGAVSGCRYFDLLPEWMQEMDIDLLMSIQNLHDNEANWQADGLSEAGRQMVQSTCQEHDIPLPEFFPE